jgi:hypothetical protein
MAEEPQDPQPILPYDDRPRPIQVPAGKFMTLAQASKKTGRPVRVLQRWVKTGVLPARYKQATWPHGTLVTDADLAAVKDRRHWGSRRSRKPRVLTTDSGQTVMLRAQARTDSYQE